MPYHHLRALAGPPLALTALLLTAPLAGASDDHCAGNCPDGRPQVMTLRSTGEDGSATNHHRDPTKVSCEGDPMFAPEVFITASDKADPNAANAKIWFQGLVALGETFHINAANEGLTRLSSETWVHIDGLDGSRLQVVRFHTSCSQPLFHGDQFGSLRLEACLSECADDPAVPYCFADQGDCPCGLDYPGGGCPNTSGAGGVLEATGTSSVASDDLRFHAYQLLPNQFGLYFMGRAQIRGMFGGGLRCVGAGGLEIFRFPVEPISADGTLDLGPGIAQYTLDNFLPTGHILAGDTWNFQVWYRDPATDCSLEFNLTNGVSITFTP